MNINITDLKNKTAQAIQRGKEQAARRGKGNLKSK